MKAVYNSWGPGKYDPRFNLDGKNKPAVIPPAYGLDGIHKITSPATATRSRTGTAMSRVTQMGGHGNVHRAAPDRQRHQRHRGPGQRQAARAAGLPAVAGGADAARRQLRCRGGRTRQGWCSRAPASARPATAATVHRRQHAAAPAAADSVAEPETPELCVALRDQAVPHRAAARRLAARAVLPRRLRADAGRRGRAYNAKMRWA